MRPFFMKYFDLIYDWVEGGVLSFCGVLFILTPSPQQKPRNTSTQLSCQSFTYFYMTTLQPLGTAPSSRIRDKSMAQSPRPISCPNMSCHSRFLFKYMLGP